MGNKPLLKAQRKRDDEFYTQYDDVARELAKYDFQGKWVYLPCDAEDSAFWQWFVTNFNAIGLSLLTATHLDEEGSYRIDFDGKNTIKTPLLGDGDFMSDECTAIKDHADIIVTNPPFSRFIDFIKWCGDKKVITVGSIAGIAYKAVFPLVRDGKLWVSGKIKEFIKPNGEKAKFGNTVWFTNVGEHFHLPLETNPLEQYQRYDNYDAINVDKIKEIPTDYAGKMGVPITYAAYYNPNEYAMIGIRRGDNGDLRLNGKEKFSRIIIQKKI